MAHCSQCPGLRAQIAQQQQLIAQLNARVELLRRQLAQLLGGVRGTVTFIDREHDDPTMPRRNLMPAIHQRLTYLLDLAEGKRH